jgi:O-antigen ligase/polysaccharide polymerase Wzy-like membrane protein
VGLTAAVNGGYFPTEWGWPALAFVLVALLAVLLRDRVELSRLELATVAAFAALLLWTLLSIAWSVSATEPVLAVELLLVYVTFLPAALLVTTRGNAALLPAGVAAAAFCVCAYALATRFFPGTLESWPPADGFQLATPIGYWNGIGILAAMGALAAIWFVATAPRVWRALAAATLPVLVVALYLTFSRGSAAAFALGLLVAFALERRRLRFAAVATLSLVFAGAGVLFARHAHALTQAGASLGAASHAGHRLAIVVVLCTLASATVGWSLMPEATLRPIGAAVVGLVVLACVGALVKEGGPVRLVDRATKSFRAPLPASGGDLNRRLSSLSSNGRTEYWRVALVEIRDVPVLGGGAGSFERYWNRNRHTSYETRNAHSLYLETLAELGPLGLVLLLVALALPLVRARALPGAAAAYVAFLAHAAIDWDWQIPADTLAALACAAALLAASRPLQQTATRPISGRVRGLATALLVPLAACAIVVEVGNSALARSSSALDAVHPAAAADYARRGHTWAPWSAEPWQRLGEAQLLAGDLAAARSSFRHALRLDGGDWSIWYDLAEASSGAARAEALAHAKRLDPRSPEVASLERG